MLNSKRLPPVLLLILVFLSSCGGATESPLNPTPTTPPALAPTGVPSRPVTTVASATPTRAALPLATMTSVAVPASPASTPGSVIAPTAVTTAQVTASGATNPILVVTNSTGRHISFVDPTKGVVSRLEVGAAPWGLALAPPSNRVYVATAEGIAVVDTVGRKRLALMPYRNRVGPPQYGEYRPGGMGIAVSPNGKQLYVGVYLSNQPSQLEIFDTEKLTSIGAVSVGLRPFQVLVSQDGREVYSIDHDSFAITVVDPVKLSSRTLNVAPLGQSAFDKPHYAALRPEDGHLLLPIQGRSLVDLDPASGKFSTVPLKSNTHQHGVALSADSKKLFIVGTGPAGEVNGDPSLTIFNLSTNTEEVLPLARPHENVALSQDGRWAYLTGGYSFNNGGWDGLTAVDLQNRTTREISVPDRPLDIVLW